MASSARTGSRAATSRTAEAARLEEARRGVQWRRWGPYLSERQWGTVREDYSEHGRLWEYFPHEHARSRAYRWGEDGLLGLCDHHSYGDDLRVECPTGSGRVLRALPGAGAAVRRGPGLAGPRVVLRVLPRGHRAGAGGQPPDGVDRPG